MRKKKQPEPQLIYLGAWMEALGVKVGELVTGTGISQGYVSNIIRNNKKDASVQKMLRISNFLHVPINDLYTKPPSAAQLAPLRDLSPEARAALLTGKLRKN